MILTFFMLLFWLAILGVAIYINYLVAKKFEAIAFQKGYDVSVHTFAMCFWLGLPGYLYVIALPNKKSENVSASSTSTYDVKTFNVEQNEQ